MKKSEKYSCRIDGRKCKVGSKAHCPKNLKPEVTVAANCLQFEYRYKERKVK